MTGPGPSPELCRFVHAAVLEKVARSRVNGVAPTPRLRAEVAELCAQLVLGSWPAGDWERLGATPPAAVAAAAHADPQGTEPALVSLSIAACQLGVSLRTMQRLTGAGVLPSTRVGRRRLVARADLDEYVRAQREEAS